MKKLILILVVVVFAMPSYGNIINGLNKNEIQTDKNNIIDSLNCVIQKIEQQFTETGKLTTDLNNQIMTMHDQLNNTQTNVHNQVIYILAIICIVMLISLILILLVWRKLNKRINNLTEDHDKTNEALNLHIKNTSEEITAINESMAGKEQKN
jgi:predicted PurR-regulated permease PerM